jgi:hypothetical protein
MLEILKKEIRGYNPQAKYTDRVTAAYRRSSCQLLPTEGCRVVSATDPHGRKSRICRPGAATFTFK